MVASVIEPLGNDMDVYMSTPLHEHVVGRVPARTGVEFGKKVNVSVDLERAYFFAPGPIGRNLGLSADAPAGAAVVNGVPTTGGAESIGGGTVERTPAVVA